MQRLVLKSEPGSTIEFHSPVRDDGHWLESYVVTLEAHDLRASATVSNPGYGQPPSTLVQKLATQWTGWKGSERWGAIDGELEIEATCDGLGHVKLEFKVPGHSESSAWSASSWVQVEAGQLDRLAEEFNAFFARGA